MDSEESKVFTMVFLKAVCEAETDTCNPQNLEVIWMICGSVAVLEETLQSPS